MHLTQPIPHETEIQKIRLERMIERKEEGMRLEKLKASLAEKLHPGQHSKPKLIAS